MSERKPGWYWVKAMAGCPWECSYWTGNGWDDNEAHEYEPENVGPRIPSPDESWFTVPIEPTEEMMQRSTWSGNGDVSVSEPWARAVVYRRMLTAAPKP